MDKYINEDLLSGGFSEKINDIAKEINNRKQELFISKCLELGITFNLKEEEQRRFRSFIREIQDEEEVIYYNDGSVEGLRVITFVSETNIDCTDTSYSITSDLRYY
jgi:hypothetical protein